MPGMHATGTLGILSSSEMDRDIAAHNGVYGWLVQSGAVTFSATLTFNVAAVAIGDCIVNSVVNTAAYAGGTVTLGAQDATNPRVDLVVITSGGAVSVVAGTPKALTTTSGPVPTAPSSTQLEIARIYVPASGTALTSANITDRRVPIAQSPFDGIRTHFRAPRRLLAEYSASGSPIYEATAGAVGGTGMGLRQTASTAGVALSSVLLEAIATWTPGAAATVVVGSATPTAFYTCTAPNKNPRMLIRWYPGASAANLTNCFAGFFSAIPTATINGAYLRANTTGNLFFVVSQGAVASTTDLGVRPTTPTSYEIFTEDAGVTWVCRNVTTNAVVSTLTTNVPTATVALGYGFSGIIASNIEFANITYMRVESNSVA